MNPRKTAPPRGVLSTATADPRRYSHARYHPSADLEAYVEHYWSVQWDLDGVAPERVETLPHPSVHLIFERGVGARVAGVTRGRFSRLLEGRSAVIAAKFRPGGFHAFARAPIVKLTDRTVPLGDIFGAVGVAVEHAVERAHTDADRMTAIEDFLRRQQPAPDEHAARAGEIVSAVAECRDIVKVEDLVSRHGISARTLQRLFAKYVGVTPKWVIQRYRLHEAAETLGRGPAIDQAALALALGYADQAHFVRDFKAMVGTSPAAYARRARSEPARRSLGEGGACPP
jgi:AraC-like DNA-binding protein